MNCEIYFVRDRDQRCGKGCYLNWTKYGQKIPKYQICICTKKNYLLKINDR